MASEAAAPAAVPALPTVAGQWHPPRSSLSVDAVLVDRGSGDVVAIDADGLDRAVAPRKALTVSARVGAIERRIGFPDGSVFVTGDNDGVDRLLAGGRRPSGLSLHGMERFHPRLIAFAVAAAILCFAVYRYALPALVYVAVAVTPPVVPELMSQGALETLDTVALSPSRLPLAEQQSLTADFERLAAVSPGGVDGLSLYFRDGGHIGPNAFALPDGTIVITDQLIAMAKGDRDLVLGVLAHEIGHVEEEHSLHQFYRAAGVAGLIMLIAGDVGDGVEELLVQGGGLLSLSFSRAHEEAADRYAVTLMAKAGRDPAALARFFELLERTYGDDSESDFLSTHPGTPERRRLVIEHAEAIAGGAR